MSNETRPDPNHSKMIRKPIEEMQDLQAIQRYLEAAEEYRMPEV